MPYLSFIPDYIVALPRYLSQMPLHQPIINELLHKHPQLPLKLLKNSYNFVPISYNFAPILYDFAPNLYDFCLKLYKFNPISIEFALKSIDLLPKVVQV